MSDTAGETPQSSASSKLSFTDFEILTTLSKGSFATVYLAHKRDDPEDQLVALKVVPKVRLLDIKRMLDAFTERNVMSRLRHPYLLRLRYTFQGPDRLFFVLDFHCGGDLSRYLGGICGRSLPFETVKLYAAEVFLALRHLHENNVIYRDLKPENILLTTHGHCVLADFGLAKDFAGPSEGPMTTSSFVGSPYYVSPDVLRRTDYTESVDWWSFGVLVYRMLFGKPPFTGRTTEQVFESIRTTQVTFPSRPGLAAQRACHIKDFICRLLAKDNSQRITADEIQKHGFWEGLNFDLVMEGKVRPQGWILPPPPRVAPDSGDGTARPNPAAEAHEILPSVGHVRNEDQRWFQYFTFNGVTPC